MRSSVLIFPFNKYEFIRYEIKIRLRLLVILSKIERLFTRFVRNIHGIVIEDRPAPKTSTKRHFSYNLAMYYT